MIANAKTKMKSEEVKTEFESYINGDLCQKSSL